MSQEDILHFTSAASSANASDDWMLHPHDSRVSTQVTENDELEEELNSLRHSKTVIAQQYAEFLEKNDGIELAKKQEPLIELETEIKALREETGVEPGELDLKLLLAKNLSKKKQRKQATTELGESQASPEIARDTAKAEVEGLRHVSRASKKLEKQDDANAQQKLELIHQVQGCMAQLEELEFGGGSGNSIQGCLDTIPSPKLDYSAVTIGACITPIEVEDAEIEIEELREYLSTMEMENKALMAHLTNYANSYHKLAADFDAQVEHIHALRETNLTLTTTNDNLVSQLETQMQLLRIRDQNTEQQVAQARAELTAEYQARINALEAQRQRTYSIFSDPEFIASLRDSTASIHSLSRSLTPTVPCSNLCCTGSAAAPAPNVTLNITLRPNDTGLWSLLRHVQRSMFWTSLNIEGPQQLVQEFLASIEQADREFQEQARRVARIERAVADRAEDFEMLREWLG